MNIKSKRKEKTTEASSTSVTPTQVTQKEQRRIATENYRELGTDTISDASTTHYNGSKAGLSRTSLTFNGKRYITLREYSKVRGITEWYSQKLCRLGKVDAIKVGSLWFIRK